MEETMGDLMKVAAKFGFYLLAILIVGWTGFHTYDILYSTNPIPEQTMLAVYGLIVFEAGTLIWFFAFLKHAEGMGQHVISLFGTIVGAALVLVAFIMDYTIPRSELTGYNSMARWAVVVATSVDFIFVLLYELMNPQVWEDLQENIHVAILYAKAETKARQKIEEDSDRLAEQIATNRKDRAFARATLGGIKAIPTADKNHPSLTPRNGHTAQTTFATTVIDPNAPSPRA
jgi:hypothetical protein